MTARSFLYLRHGRTEANDRGLCSGAYCASPLTDEGRAQIAAAAETLHGSGLVPDMMFFSPAPRAQATADILRAYPAHAHLAAVPMEDLRERHMGAWEGQKFEGFREALMAGETGAGGEARDVFHARVQRALDALITGPTRLPLAVSHGLVWQALHDLHGAEAPWIENGGLFLVTVADGRLRSEKV